MTAPGADGEGRFRPRFRRPRASLWSQCRVRGLPQRTSASITTAVRVNVAPSVDARHEISGRVVAAEGGRSVAGESGDRPLRSFLAGECELCASGHGTICRRRADAGKRYPGGFATTIRVPARGLCLVDDGAAARAAGPGSWPTGWVPVVADAGDDPVPGGWLQAEVRPGDFAVVVGCRRSGRVRGADRARLRRDVAALDSTP